MKYFFKVDTVPEGAVKCRVRCFLQNGVKEFRQSYFYTPEISQDFFYIYSIFYYILKTKNSIREKIAVC